jgi:hypothetical protein
MKSRLDYRDKNVKTRLSKKRKTIFNKKRTKKINKMRNHFL